MTTARRVASTVLSGPSSIQWDMAVQLYDKVQTEFDARKAKDARLDFRAPRRYRWNQSMKASLLYRIAAVLLLLFAAGHTLGFSQTDPTWGVDTLLYSMRSIHFDVQGFSRTYWDFFAAASFTVGLFYLFSAVLAWQLGGLPALTLAGMRTTVWAFALCFAAITLVSWSFLFILPIAMSSVITVCLTMAASVSAKPG
jgi:hypothetical protein